MADKQWYLLSYDIRDANRLRRVAKHLLGYGERLQYSVFRCRLSQRQLERLQWELLKIIEKDDDLLIIGLCKTCSGKVRTRGGQSDWEDEPSLFEII
jgi:CRISPR-associated protein Cas2